MFRAGDFSLPTTLAQNRRGIHIFIIYLLGIPPLLYNPTRIAMGVAATYFAYTGVTIVDATVGGAFLKAFDRALGSGFALLLIIPWLLFFITHNDTVETASSTRWALVFYATAVCFLWGYLHFLYPIHRALPISAMSTIAFFTMHTNGNENVNSVDSFSVKVAKLMAGRASGLLLGLFVTQLVMRVKARDILLSNMTLAVYKLSRLMVPLIALDTGMVEDKNILECISSGIGEHLNKRPCYENLSSQNSSHKADQQSGYVPPTILDFEYFKALKESIWEEVENVYRLLQNNKLVITASKFDFSFVKPRRFPLTAYNECRDAVEGLFYHVVNLYLVLDTQEAFYNRSEQAADILAATASDQFAWISHLRVGDELMVIANAKNPNIRKYVTEPSLHRPKTCSVPDSVLKGRNVISRFDTMVNRLGFWRQPAKQNKPVRDSSISFLSCNNKSSNFVDMTESYNFGEEAKLHEESGLPEASRSVYDLSVNEVYSLISGPPLAMSGSNASHHQILTWRGISNKPLLKWQDDFGPAIGRISRHVTSVISAMHTTLDKTCLDVAMFTEISAVERSLKAMCVRKWRWQKCVEDMLKMNLIQMIHFKDESRRSVFDPVLVEECIGTILGVDVSAYKAMSVECRSMLWSNLGHVRDKMNRSASIMLAITTQLYRCIDRICVLAIEMNWKDAIETIMVSGILTETNARPTGCSASTGVHSTNNNRSLMIQAENRKPSSTSHQSGLSTPKDVYLLDSVNLAALQYHKRSKYRYTKQLIKRHFGIQ